MTETGYIHSYTTASAHDGPGLRTVVWTTGCHFRCQYCHNPDTWHLTAGRKVCAATLVEELACYAPFIHATGGGVTISGGEPLVQAPFTLSVLRGCKARGFHTALDTNGFLGDCLTDEDLTAIDLVILDLKSYLPETHRLVTGKEVAPVLRFARRLAALGRPTWVRFVLVPGLTNGQANLEGLATFMVELDNLERVEVLPFHQLGRTKWDQLGLSYPLTCTPPASPEAVARVVALFRAHGLRVVEA